MKQATLDIEVREQHHQPVLSIRTRTDVTHLPELIGDAYQRIGRYLEELDVEPDGAPFVAYYNQDMKDLDVEIGFLVEDVIPVDHDMSREKSKKARWSPACILALMKRWWKSMGRYTDLLRRRG